MEAKHISIGLGIVIFFVLGITVLAHVRPQADNFGQINQNVQGGQAATSSKGESVNAKSLTLNLDLNLKQYPGVSFKIGNIYKTGDRIPSSLCTKIHSIWTTPSTITSCGMDVALINNEKQALIVVELSANNPTSLNAGGTFVHLSWKDASGVEHFSTPYINWASYGVPPFNSTEWAAGFKVPASADQFTLYWGNYNKDFKGDSSHQKIVPIDLSNASSVSFNS